ARWGVQTEEADGGETALSCLQAAATNANPFQLILMDVMMPGIDGFAALAKIRRDPHLNQPAILMLSSIDRRTDITRARELGAAAYLVKPVLAGELRAAIAEALAVGRGTLQARRVRRP